MRQSSVTSNTLWANLNSFWADCYTKIFCFCVNGGAPDFIYSGTSLYEHILWMHLKKKSDLRTHISSATHVVKVRFTMMYSSRKLNNNNKVINTVCNFWKQIARSFQVYGRTNHFCAKSTRKTLVWIARFFSPDQHWRHKLFFPTIFPTALRR